MVTRVIGAAKRVTQGLLRHLGDRSYVRVVRLLQQLRHGRFPWPLNLRTPRTWSDKITLLALDADRLIPRARDYTDKLAARALVADTVGDEHLTTLYGIWDRAADIDWDALPHRFVVKTNHGSSFNIVVADKSLLDTTDAAQQLDRWLAVDYSKVHRERQYIGIEPRLFAEEYLGTDAEPAPAIKAQCFGGRVEFFQIEIGPLRDRRYEYVSRHWEPLDLRKYHPPPDTPTPRPTDLKRLITVSEALSAPLPYVRVDLYVIDARILFGEFTLTPGAGQNPWHPRRWDRRLGDLVHLPEPSTEIE
jgi:hypothetical protein